MELWVLVETRTCGKKICKQYMGRRRLSWVVPINKWLGYISVLKCSYLSLIRAKFCFFFWPFCIKIAYITYCWFSLGLSGVFYKISSLKWLAGRPFTFLEELDSHLSISRDLKLPFLQFIDFHFYCGLVCIAFNYQREEPG